MRRHLLSISLVLGSPICIGAPSHFLGEWSHVSGCPNGNGIAVRLVEGGGQVTGKWQEAPFIEGTSNGVNTYGGHSGKLKGKVSGKRLFVRTCEVSVEDDRDPGACPRYSPAGYFERSGADLIWVKARHQRVTMHRALFESQKWSCVEAASSNSSYMDRDADVVPSSRR